MTEQATKQLSKKIADAGAAMVPTAFDNAVKGWYKSNRKKVNALAGGEDRAALFVAAMFAQINRTPDLLNCSQTTLFQCLVYSIGTNLLPGPMAESYFIPFKDEAVFVPSYQGLIKLMYNSGFVTRVTGHVVLEKDDFHYDCAREEISHVKFDGPRKDAGKRVGAYVMIKNIYGETIPVYKNAEFIEGIKARSRGAKSNFSPWNSKHETDVDAMWLKTVVRQAAKFVPKNSTPQSVQFSRAIELSNAEDTGDKPEAAELLSEDVELVKQEILIGEKKE